MKTTISFAMGVLFMTLLLQGISDGMHGMFGNIATGTFSMETKSSVVYEMGDWYAELLVESAYGEAARCNLHKDAAGAVQSIQILVPPQNLITQNIKKDTMEKETESIKAALAGIYDITPQQIVILQGGN